jgi:hypothetical protein
VSVRLYLRAEFPPGQEAVGAVVHVVMIGFMGAVTLLGAFLLWSGTKRTGRSRRFEGCNVEAA